MPFPSPTERQARILWMGVTALAVTIITFLLATICWSAGWLINKLSPVLLPLGFAAILAYLLDPVVDFLERLKIPRTRAIILVFFMALMLVLILLATVVPKLVVETKDLVDQAPKHVETIRNHISEWMGKGPLGTQARKAWDEKFAKQAEGFLSTAVPGASSWVLHRLHQAASWLGLLAGFALVPVFAFYFLLEKEGIVGGWAKSLPLKESRLKEEVVFILTSVNDYLIVFIRGQVLVSLSVGVLLSTGFLMIGLNYAVLIGLIAAILGIIPYLGITVSLITALTVSAIQFGWTGPLMVLGIVGAVQALEGFVIAPKIIGGRVGLHPLAIIVAVLAGTTLMGGLIGGMLAIPLTAALRVLLRRYIWKKP